MHLAQLNKEKKQQQQMVSTNLILIEIFPSLVKSKGVLKMAVPESLWFSKTT